MSEYQMPPIRNYHSRMYKKGDYPAFKGSKVVRMAGSKAQLNKKRSYLKNPEDWYMFQEKEVTESNLDRQKTFNRALHVPHIQRTRHNVKKMQFDPLFNKTFHSPRQPEPRKGMLIGEPTTTTERKWKSPEPNRTELPGNLFLDNLKHQDVDWDRYRNVTWKDILSSYRKDISARLSLGQSIQQKEQWLARLEDRVADTRNDFDRSLQIISPRLFHPAAVAKRQKPIGKYQMKDGMGIVYSLGGPTDYSKKELKPIVFEEPERFIPTPKKLDF